MTNSTKTLDPLWRNETYYNELLAEWEANKTGILVDTSENQVAWLRLSDDDPIWENATDPASGPTTAHFEFLFQVRSS